MRVSSVIQYIKYIFFPNTFWLEGKKRVFQYSMYPQQENFSSSLYPRDKNKYLECNNICIKNIFWSKFSECLCSASKRNISKQPCHKILLGRAFCDTVKYNYTDMIKFSIPKHYKVGRFVSMLEVTAAKVNTSWVTQQLIWPLLKVNMYKMTTPILTFPVPL